MKLDLVLLHEVCQISQSEFCNGTVFEQIKNHVFFFQFELFADPIFVTDGWVVIILYVCL